MEITKRIKAIPKDIDLLMTTSQNIDLKYAERDGRELINDYEYEKFNFKLIFETPDNEIKEELKKARGFKKIWELYKKHNKEAITEYIEKEIKKHEEEIKKLKNLL